MWMRLLQGHVGFFLSKQKKQNVFIGYKHLTTSSSLYRQVALRSQIWIPTEKETPADAAIASHQLLIRGGFIRKSGHGVFTFLPLGKKILARLEQIIDEEMAQIGGNKLDLPLLIPSELWRQSGRWTHRGPELITFADRREEIWTLAPTHEESITSLVAQHFDGAIGHGSFDNTLRLYQIGKKFRDEIRPRFGLLRAREFIMKDMYSFDTDFDKALKTYEDVVKAYNAILIKRLRLPIAQVEADSGNIGGNLSHEFHVLAPIGEDAILSCEDLKGCQYAANVEKAQGKAKPMCYKTIEDKNILALVDEIRKSVDDKSISFTHLWTKIVDLANALEMHENENGFICKVLQHCPPDDEANKDANPQKKNPFVAVIFGRQDRKINELSIKPFLPAGIEEMQFTKSHQVSKELLTQVDESNLKIFVDDAIFCGPQQDPHSHDYNNTNVAVHILQELVNQNAENQNVHLGHFRLAEEGDICPKCLSSSSKLKAKRGIEVGHVFYLGQKYSKPFEVTHMTQEGKQLVEMGCFGMGVTRLLAAIVEVSHDEKGIIWPFDLAPFKVIIQTIGNKKKKNHINLLLEKDPLVQAAFTITNELISFGMDPKDILLDDRWYERAGFKLTESELLGFPYRIVVGKSFEKEGRVEVQERQTLERVYLLPSELSSYFKTKAKESKI
jgi:prolyl-tRNA synthetase